MNKLPFRRLIISLLILALAVPMCQAQSFDRPSAPSQQKSSSHKGPLKHKTVKIKGPKAVEKSKKDQEAKQGKLKKDYGKYVKENQKRSIEIQSPEVKARMKQNIKDADASYKTKHKNSASRTRRAGNKYR
ncbi:MAG TPA: hypothetical protein VFB97_01385 [Bacteroidales bacterium]|nr:hypothetical protein [Bacteroidales bacterium]